MVKLSKHGYDVGAAPGAPSTSGAASPQQQDRIIGGPKALARRLAHQLDVRLDTPAQSVRQHDDTVIVQTQHGTLVAGQVVVAIPPALYGRIDFQPGLPGPKAQLHQHMPMGSVIKTHTIYTTPWWRDLGLNGQANGADQPVGVVFDNSPADGTAGV